MTPRNRLKFLTAVAALTVVGLAAANNPASAAERPTHLGPVGPSEPILATVGNKRLIAFYVPDSGRCSINVVLFDAAPAEAPDSSARCGSICGRERCSTSTRPSRSRSIFAAVTTP